MCAGLSSSRREETDFLRRERERDSFSLYREHLLQVCSSGDGRGDGERILWRCECAYRVWRMALDDYLLWSEKRRENLFFDPDKLGFEGEFYKGCNRIDGCEWGFNCLVRAEVVGDWIWNDQLYYTTFLIIYNYYIKIV